MFTTAHTAPTALTAPQMTVLETVRDYGPIALANLAEEVLDCEPFPAEIKAIRAANESLANLGLVTIDSTTVRVTALGRTR